MLDLRLYRAAFVPVILAVLVAAFSFGERPRPIRTTLAPDAFDGSRAYASLAELDRTFPRRRPGSVGDLALADRTTRELRRALAVTDVAEDPVRVFDRTAETIDGEATVRTVVGERAGRDSRRIVVIAHRDAAATADRASLSGTAALLELARLFRGRVTRRTLTLVSTSGGTGGEAGVRELVDRLPGPTDAVIVLGDMASRVGRGPLVVPWSDGGGAAPMRLRRTVEEAVRQELGRDAGSPRALFQIARLAAPMTFTAQGPLGAGGLSAVTLQASGERSPPRGAVVTQARLDAFGRAALRSISALDNGPDVPSGPREYLIAQRRIVPRWTVGLISGALLLPLLAAAVDGLARVRRRRAPVLPWLRWVLVASVPFLLVAVLARLTGLIGLVPSLPSPADPAALPPDPAVLLALALVLVLGFLLRAPLARLVGARSLPEPGDVAGASAALALVLLVVAVAVWLVNPYTALLLAPAVHLWLLAAVPEVRLPRWACVATALAGLLPALLLALVFMSQLSLGPVELAWVVTGLLAGGTAGPAGVLAWSLVGGCVVSAVLLAMRKPPGGRDGGGDGPGVSTRGPLSYAGPGSLGGTSSALRR